MRRHLAIGCLAALTAAAGCTTTKPQASGEKRVLQVRWQRLVDEKGRTCDRCGGTEKAASEAVQKLRRALKPLNIEVALEKTVLSTAEFSRDPQESNRIWIGGKPAEEWLQGTVGKSQCSGACGDSECRTLTVDGRVYESLPAELIVRAGLLAGAELLRAKNGNPWNPMAEWSPACCPPSIGGGR